MSENKEVGLFEGLGLDPKLYVKTLKAIEEYDAEEMRCHMERVRKNLMEEKSLPAMSEHPIMDNISKLEAKRQREYMDDNLPEMRQMTEAEKQWTNEFIDTILEESPSLPAGATPIKAWKDPRTTAMADALADSDGINEEAMLEAWGHTLEFELAEANRKLAESHTHAEVEAEEHDKCRSELTTLRASVGKLVSSVQHNVDFFEKVRWGYDGDCGSNTYVNAIQDALDELLTAHPELKK